MVPAPVPPLPSCMWQAAQVGGEICSPEAAAVSVRETPLPVSPWANAAAGMERAVKTAKVIAFFISGRHGALVQAGDGVDGREQRALHPASDIGGVLPGQDHPIVH